jgi:hypothetical protein
MTDKKQPQTEIKHFNLIISGEQMTTTGNMALNEVASALVTLAYWQGRQDGGQKEITNIKEDE